MKPIPLTILAFSAWTMAAVAQGTVNWTGPGPVLHVETNSTVYSAFAGSGGQPTGGEGVGFTPGAAIAQFYYELLVSSTASIAPATVSDLANWSDTGLWATNRLNAAGMITVANPATNAAANNWPAGATANLVLVGWSANLGSTYAGVMSELQAWSMAQTSIAGTAYFGVSAMGTLASGTGTSGVSVFGIGAGQINNSITSGNPLQLDELLVPEPGTLTLAVLGGCSLFWVRRRSPGQSLTRKGHL